MPPSPASWAVFPSRNPNARLRLFCFPYAGGGASIYSRWHRFLPREVEVVAVQPPGREGRLMEKPYSDLLELAARLHTELQPWFDRPFAFYGHSNGGLMAFELARALRRAGNPLPRHLFVGGRPAPHLPMREVPIHALPDAEFLQELRKLAGTPEEVLANTEIMELLMPLLRADFSLGETYRYLPEPPLPIPLSAYGGQMDEEVSIDEVRGWSEHTSGPFHFQEFPGNHFFINGDREAVLGQLSLELMPLLRNG
jgi:medium-chain acyl-[acyl-carrier-protein] hydrolase